MTVMIKWARIVLRLVVPLLALALLLPLGVIAVAAVLPTGPQIVFMSDRQGATDLFMLDLRTGAVQALTTTPFSSERYPAWSPDGEMIAYHANFAPQSGLGDYNLHLMRPDGTGVQSLYLWRDIQGFNEAMVTWSPDGEQIGFHSGLDSIGYNVFISSTTEQDFAPVTAGAGWFFHMDWSPDGSRIVFTGLYDGQENIYLLDIGQGYADPQANIERMRLLAEDSFFPAWSPDGRYIAYVSDRGGTNDIYVLDLQTGDRRNLTGLHLGADDTHPDWSPDGRYIVFASDRASPNLGAGVTQGFDLYRMRPNGEDVRRLTYDDDHGELAPDWKP
jgi:TolB protein